MTSLMIGFNITGGVLSNSQTAVVENDKQNHKCNLFYHIERMIHNISYVSEIFNKKSS